MKDEQPKFPEARAASLLQESHEPGHEWWSVTFAFKGPDPARAVEFANEVERLLGRAEA